MPILTKRLDKAPLGIYVHVPFCRSKCQYCDFYSLTTRESSVLDSYQDAVCAHIREAGALAPGYKVDTIYFGGGTPSFFGADGMATILTTTRRNFDVDNNAEITFEANPDSISDKLLRRLRSEGFNRISMGIQCDDDEILKKLGRPHTYAQAQAAYHRIRKAGFRNISVDLMYGLPGQTMDMWKRDVEEMLSLHVPHLSAYSLQWEEGTPLYLMLERGEVEEASDELSRGMYEYFVKATSMHSMEHYEVSNYAMPGMRARHNSGYWRDEPYVGLGPGAHSYDGVNVRSSNPSDLQKYIMSGGMPEREVEILDEDALYEEKVLKGLRTVGGLDLSALAPKYREYALKMAEPHIRNGRMVQCDGVLRLTEDGIFVSNDIMSDMML